MKLNNLAVRTLAGAAFVALVVTSLLFFPIYFGILFLIFMVVALSEFYHISIGNLFYFTQTVAAVTSIIFFVLVFLNRAGVIGTRWIWTALLPLLSVQISTIFLSVNERRELSRLMWVYAGIGYIALPFSLASCLVFRNGTFDGMLLLSFFILIWMNDTGAYCLGTAFGQRPGSKKLAPHISPKKSWVGFWGGMAFCVGSCVALKYLHFIDIPLVHAFALGIVVSVGGVAGDLCESVWKRYFGVKDSGHCIPGHGGMLDRFDSSLIAIPLACVYLSFFNLI